MKATTSKSLPNEILGPILSDIVAEVIHEVLIFSGTFAFKVHQNPFKHFDFTDELLPRASQKLHISKMVNFMRFHPILKLCHVNNQYRLIVERILASLCPIMFTDKYNFLITSNAKSGIFILDSEKYRNPDSILKSLSILRGISATCMGVGTIACSDYDDLNETFSYLTIREPACDTPLARVYLMWARLRVSIFQVVEAVSEHKYTNKMDHSLELSKFDGEFCKGEGDLLRRGVYDLAYLYYQYQLGELLPAFCFTIYNRNYCSHAWTFNVHDFRMDKLEVLQFEHGNH